MQRLLMDALVEWKDNQKRKPLVLQGVRQCGKTYLLKEFGAQHYQDVLYCKFDGDEHLSGLFEQNLDPHRIIKDLSLYNNRDIKPGDTLIIFDEVQSCGKALTSLKYFYEEAPEYHIIAAGSLLGVAVPKGTSFPVGKVEFLTLYPMNFYEFLLELNPMLANHLRESPCNDDAWRTFRVQLTEKYREYLIVGGMPEAVQAWVDTESIEKVERIQDQIITSYENDFGKHAPLSYFPKLSAIWGAIPSQLAKENRKFIFSQVKKSWRAKDLEDALEWLIRSGLVYKVINMEKPFLPLSAYANHTFFKLYLCDTGLLRRLAKLPASVFFDKTENYREFKGAMAENYVCCELKRIFQQDIYYWTAQNPGQAEVEFVVQDDIYIIPIEVKAKSASHARSLKRYCELFNPKKSVLTSLEDVKENILPLYGFWDLRKWLDNLTPLS